MSTKADARLYRPSSPMRSLSKVGLIPQGGVRLRATTRDLAKEKGATVVSHPLVAPQESLVSSLVYSSGCANTAMQPVRQFFVASGLSTALFAGSGTKT